MIRTLLILGDQEGDRAKAAIKRGWMVDPNPKDVFPFLQVQRGPRGRREGGGGVRRVVRRPFEDGREQKRREKRGCNKRDEGKMNKNDGETEGVYK